MVDDNISINSVNVELTQKRRLLILRQIAPLRRLLDSSSTPHLDIVIRTVRRPLSGATYCIMVRLTSGSQTFYAVAMSRFFDRAIRDARDELRKSMSRSYTPDTKTLSYLRERAHERYFVELFV